MISKEFLLIECANLRAVLNETLGYNYGIEGTEAFYAELTIRIDFIESQLNSIAATDAINLQPYTTQLVQISTLISRIERSRLGEYSWPFVEEFKKIAKDIWSQNEQLGTSVKIFEGDGDKQERQIKTLKEDSAPMMFVLSEGGLASYSILIEQKKASSSRLQILTIQFPRTLKHFVLLHPILGHELGHALYAMSKFRTELNNILDTLCQSSSKFNSPQATANWIFDDRAPNDFKVNLVKQSKKNNLTKDNFSQMTKWTSWKEEILCDLIGLLIFGPSFLAALNTLLHSLDTSGYLIKPKHPMTASRINLMLSASKILKYDNIKLTDPVFESNARHFWDHLESCRKTDPWFDLFTEPNIKIALDSLKALIGNSSLAFYPAHSTGIIEPLVKQLSKLIPPVGYKVNSTSDSPSFHVDFRHILYAGWLASEHLLPDDDDEEIPKKIDFNILNRLCQHGIMQQIAVDLR